MVHSNVYIAVSYKLELYESIHKGQPCPAQIIISLQLSPLILFNNLPSCKYPLVVHFSWVKYHQYWSIHLGEVAFTEKIFTDEQTKWPDDSYIALKNFLYTGVQWLSRVKFLWVFFCVVPLCLFLSMHWRSFSQCNLA